MMDTLRPYGDFLQIGFGKKGVASAASSFHPKSYTLVESDPFVLEKVNVWAAKHPEVVLVRDPWQQALIPLGLFDTIYCELADFGGLWPDFAHIRYSDRDLETFCDIPSKTNPEQLFRFLHELAHNGQISEEQLEAAVKKHHLKGPVPKMKKSCRQMVACLKICLDAHMRPGSKFAAPLDDLSIAYEDPIFAEIALDPYVEIKDYKEGIVVEKFGR